MVRPIPLLALVALAVVWSRRRLPGVRRGRPRALRDRLGARRRHGCAGCPWRRRTFFAFVLSGTLAGLAGVLFAARYATIASNAGTGLELQAVAAAVIGGVAIFGGSGTVAGAALGAVLLATIDRALPILGIPDFWQQAVVGVLIIGAIVLDRVLALRTARRLRVDRGSRDHVRPPAAGPSEGVMSRSTRSGPSRPHPPRRRGSARTAARPRLRDHRAARRRRARRVADRAPTSRASTTWYFLFLDVFPILLIALPMTLVIIIAAQIDLSVASMLGLSSVLVGALFEAGWPLGPAAAVVALVVGALGGCAQRVPGHRGRPAVARGHHRHARALPRASRSASWAPARSPGSRPVRRTWSAAGSPGRRSRR